MNEHRFKIWTIAVSILSIIATLATGFSVILYNEHQTDLNNTIYIREKLASHDSKLTDISGDVSRIDRNLELLRGLISPLRKADAN